MLAETYICNYIHTLSYLLGQKEDIITAIHIK
jgi:hypothetical protein